jgi:large conductance mechanosensitive channel
MPSGDWRANGFVLRAGATPKDDVVLKYGDLLGAVLDFFVVALALFVIVSKLLKAAEGRLGKKETAAPPTNKECPACCETIPFKATRCKFCTTELAPSALAPSPAPSP